MRLLENLVHVREEGDEVHIPHLKLVVPAETGEFPELFSFGELLERGVVGVRGEGPRAEYNAEILPFGSHFDIFPAGVSEPRRRRDLPRLVQRDNDHLLFVGDEVRESAEIVKDEGDFLPVEVSLG